MIHEVGKRPHQIAVSQNNKKHMNTYYSRFNKPKTPEQARRIQPYEDDRSTVFNRLYNDGKNKEEKYLDY